MNAGTRCGSSVVSKFIVFILPAVVVCGFVGHASGEFKYERAIVEGDPFPNGGTFGSVGEFSLDGDVVYFAGRQSPSSGQLGLYSLPLGSEAHVVADQNTLQPGGSSTFFTVGAPLGNLPGGGVIFAASNQAGTERGIYRYDPSLGNIFPVVDHNTTLPNSADVFTSFGEAFQVGQKTYFEANGSGGQDGFYVAVNSEIRTIFDATTPVPAPWNALFGSFKDFSVEDVEGDSILLLGRSGDYDAYLTTTDDAVSLDLVVDTNTPIPGYEAFNFDSLFNNAKTNGRDILFYGRSIRDPNNSNFRMEGIYGLVDGSLQVIADLFSSNPHGGAMGSGGGFGSFDGVSDFVGDQFAFFAEHDGDANGDEDGIYLGRVSVDLQLLIEEAQSIDGFVSEDLSGVSIDGNTVAFGFLSSNNVEAIYVVRIPEPSTVLLAITGFLFPLLNFRRSAGR